MENFELPDGRVPLRFDKGNAAFYMKARGEGEVRYLFSMIRHMQKNRPRLSDEERSRIAKERAQKIIQKDPNFFKRNGSIGGKNGRGSRHNLS